MDYDKMSQRLLAAHRNMSAGKVQSDGIKTLFSVHNMKCVNTMLQKRFGAENIVFSEAFFEKFLNMSLRHIGISEHDVAQFNGEFVYKEGIIAETGINHAARHKKWFLDKNFYSSMEFPSYVVERRSSRDEIGPSDYMTVVKNQNTHHEKFLQSTGIKIPKDKPCII